MHFGEKEQASFCTQYVPFSEYVPFYVYLFFLKLQLNVIDFSFCIQLLRDLLSLFFPLEMIVGLEVLGSFISVNQSTSMVNYRFPISSLSKYLKLFEWPTHFVRRHVTLLALKATSKFPYDTSPKITFFFLNHISTIKSKSFLQIMKLNAILK